MHPPLPRPLPHTLVLTDIAQLVTCQPAHLATAPPTTPDEAARRLGCISDATLIAQAGRVLWVGPSASAPSLSSLQGPLEQVSAQHGLVTPGLVDPHTHLVWAGDRSAEFEQRNLGATYQDIQHSGGGILSTVRATQQASDEALTAGLHARLRLALGHGVTTCEVKTGYGLLPPAELRLLRLIVAAAHAQPLTVSPTYLCHVPPPGLSDAQRRLFLDDLLASIPLAAQAGAHALDVYCDAGAFTLDETAALLTHARAHGLRRRCHAEQFTHTGSAALAAALGAHSVEHLELLTSHDIQCLAHSGTVANLLPGAALTLRLPWPDARRLIQAGVWVALGTDCNPGSSYTHSPALMMSLACTQMGLSSAEAWLAVTQHAARAVGDLQRGALVPGAPADLVLWDAQHHHQVSQQLGQPLVRQVFVAGCPVR